jgi:hypothetical protein
MSLKKHLCLYSCLTKDAPLAVAVYGDPAKTFQNKKGDATFPDGYVVFPIAVAVPLEERIRINRVSNAVTWTPRLDFGGAPFPFPGGFAKDDPESDSWVRWVPDAMFRQSLHFMLAECAKHDLCGFEIDLKYDWTREGLRAVFRDIDPRTKKRTGIRWLSAWQLPFWEKSGLTGAERFDRIQKIAEAYGIEPWGSKSSFDDCLAEIKSA